MSRRQEAPRAPWLRARRVRFCRSDNHGHQAAKALQKGTAALWRCPRCARGLCTACEGTGDAWSVCDACRAHIMTHRGTELYRRMVRRWGIRGRITELLKEAACTTPSTGPGSSPSAPTAG